MQKKILITLTLLLLFAACYKDGSYISFRSKINRLCHEWKVDKVTVDGIDNTQLYKDSCDCNITLQYNKFHDEPAHQDLLMYHCKFTSGLCPLPTGKWSLGNHKKTLDVNIDGWGFSEFGPICYGKGSWDILKLTNKEFWFKSSFNNKTYEFKLKAL